MRAAADVFHWKEGGWVLPQATERPPLQTGSSGRLQRVGGEIPDFARGSKKPENKDCVTAGNILTWTSYMVTMGGDDLRIRRLGYFIILAAVCCVIQPTVVSGHAPAPLSPAPASPPGSPPVKYYHFNVEYINYTVNCHTKPTLVVNGQFPGPTLYANEGDRVIVNVTNSSPDNITIHFHGVRQVRSPWMDGVAYVTMCPIQGGDYFVHDFIIPFQRGTLLWHAHYKWMRATVHGAIIAYPQFPYPFQPPHEEFPLIFAEWWYGDVQQIEDKHIRDGNAFPNSDAMTINGHPGLTYNCSEAEGVTTLKARPGKTYLLRLVNAALNTHLFFAIANHTLTVVEADSEYVQPFTAYQVFLSPGQTLNVLVTANQPGGTYYMSITGYGRDAIPIVRPVALFQYKKPSPYSDFPFTPHLSNYTDHGVVTAFNNALRTLYPGRVPLTVNRNLFLVISLTERLCNRPGDNCTTPANTSFPLAIQGAVNNVTFDLPTIALLQASYFNIPGVFTEDLPDYPLYTYNYTGPSSPPAQKLSVQGAKLVGIKFNDTVQVILQDTSSFGFEDHPFHLHGNNFYILAQGFGNYDPNTDPDSFNLWDPPLRNTVSVPFAGWAAIRIKANNPGMWLLHCHLDKHTSWGMQTVFHVHDGVTTNGTILPPPDRLIQC